MRDVNFTEVGMENFGPYIDPMILSFPNDSLTLMTGPNGIGKTMSLDAIPYTLYGITSKGAKGDDVVNNVIGRNCKTWVKFTMNGDSYEVIRYRKYSKLNNTVTITKNGGDPYKKGHIEVLPEITKLLCPKKSFMNTLMFGQKVKDFFTDLVDSDKKEIFRMILNIDRYQIYYDQAKRDYDTTNEYVSNTKNEIQMNNGLMADAKDQIQILNNQKLKFYEIQAVEIKGLKESIQINQRLLEDWQNKVADLRLKQEEFQELEKQLIDLETAEKEVDSKYDEQRQKLLATKELKDSDLNSQADKAQQELKIKAMTKEKERGEEYRNLKEDIENQIKDLLEEKNNIDRKMDKAQDALTHAELEINELQVGLQGSTCPTCLQDITEGCKDNLLTKIADKNVIIDEANILTEKELKPQRKQLMDKIQSLVEKKEKAGETFKVDLKNIELVLLQEQQNSDNKLFQALDKVKQIFEQHMQKIKTDQQDELKPISNQQQSLLMKNKDLVNVGKELVEAEMHLNSVQRKVIQKVADLKALEAKEFDDEQIFGYERKIREFEIENEELNHNVDEAIENLDIIDFWKAAFSPRGIPSMLIDESIPFMNERVSEYLDKLTNGRYIVSFDTLAETKSGEFRDKISVNVLDTQTRASSRIQLSGGQTRIIDIATILTLGDLQSNIQGVKFNILLFDEIFDSLDEENIGFVSKVLSNMKFGKSIYLISHRHEDQLEADEVLTLN